MIITYDWEFLERGPELPIIPISLGMVREDGERLYLINGEVQLSALVRHPFVQMNVVPYLPVKMELDHTADYTGGIVEWDPTHPDYSARVGLDEMRHRVLEFTYFTEPELWGYYAAYDHVVLAQLFGTMGEFPTQLPMFTRDVMQEWDRLGRPPLPPQPASIHHALHDAVWTMEAVQALKLAERERSGGDASPADVNEEL